MTEFLCFSFADSMSANPQVGVTFAFQRLSEVSACSVADFVRAPESFLDAALLFNLTKHNRESPRRQRFPVVIFTC